MSKNLKIFLGLFYLLILFTFLYFVFSGVQVSRLGDFSYYKELQTDLDVYMNTNTIVKIFYFFIFSIVWVSLLGFGSPILIFSGIIFGQWLGTLISVFSISIGALTLYIIGNFFFSDLVKSLLQKKFEKYIILFQKNEFFYFFIYRFIGGLGVPFFLQNLLPILFRMKKLNYFFASFLGFIPSFYITNTIGSGLSTYIAQADSFSIIELILTKDIYLPILMVSGLMFVSLIIKKKFFDGKI